MKDLGALKRSTIPWPRIPDVVHDSLFTRELRVHVGIAAWRENLRVDIVNFKASIAM